MVFHPSQRLRDITGRTFENSRTRGGRTIYRDDRRTAQAAISATFHTTRAKAYKIRERQQPKGRSIVIDFHIMNIHTGRYVA